MTNLICIVCPRGCHLQVDDELNVTGNGCKRGVDYAKRELTHPTRMVTSTVKIIGSIECRLPVVTKDPIPKERIFDVMKEINKAVVNCPVNIHDVVIPNVLDLGVDIIATKSILK